MILSERKTPNHRPMVAARIIPISVETMCLLVSVSSQARIESVERHLEHGKSGTKNSKTKPQNSRFSGQLLFKPAVKKHRPQTDSIFIYPMGVTTL